MMVPNQYNDSIKPNLQVVTDQYVEQLLLLEQAAGCRPSLRGMARVAIGSVAIPLHLVAEHLQNRDYE